MAIVFQACNSRRYHNTYSNEKQGKSNKPRRNDVGLVLDCFDGVGSSIDADLGSPCEPVVVHDDMLERRGRRRMRLFLTDGI